MLGGEKSTRIYTGFGGCLEPRTQAPPHAENPAFRHGEEPGYEARLSGCCSKVLAAQAWSPGFNSQHSAFHFLLFLSHNIKISLLHNVANRI